MALLLYLNDVNRRAIRRERLFRDRRNPLDYLDDFELNKLCRFRRASIIQLTCSIEHSLNKTTKSHALPPVLQVICALNFYATGSFQNQIASILNINQTTVSRALWAVTQAILEVHGRIISFPDNILLS